MLSTSKKFIVLTLIASSALSTTLASPSPATTDSTDGIIGADLPEGATATSSIQITRVLTNSTDPTINGTDTGSSNGTIIPVTSPQTTVENSPSTTTVEVTPSSSPTSTSTSTPTSTSNGTSGNSTSGSVKISATFSSILAALTLSTLTGLFALVL